LDGTKRVYITERLVFSEKELNHSNEKFVVSSFWRRYPELVVSAKKVHTRMGKHTLHISTLVLRLDVSQCQQPSGAFYWK
jgi:hypothetical protein